MKKELISRWFIVGFIISISLIILSGILSLHTFQRQNEEAKLVKHTYQVLNQVETINKLLVDMETGRRGFRSTGEKKFLQPYNTSLKKISPAIENLKLLVAGNSMQVIRVNRLKNEIFDILNFWKTLPINVTTSTRENRIRITEDEKIRMDKIRNIIDGIREVEGVQLKTQSLEYNAVIKNSRLTIGIGTLLILIIVLALIYTIIQEFRNKVQAQFDLKKNLNNLKELNQAANEKNWLLAGVSKVVDSLQDTSSTIILTQACLKSIIEYLNLPAGAFYTFDAKNEKFILLTSIGLSGKKKVFSINEGPSGYLTTAKEIKIITDIHPSNWIIESAMGVLTPGKLMGIPLWLDNELKGFIELAFFTDVEPKHIQLLNLLTNNISIGLNAAILKENMVELLDQVFKQKEVLEAQQAELLRSNLEMASHREELRASNEELEHQKKELKQTNDKLASQAEELQVSDEELRQYNSELQSQNLIIQEAGNKIEEISHYKSEFLANMSHELRTPLNSVLILAELLSENNTQNLSEKQLEYVKIIYKAGSDLVDLVNDILDLSKIEAGGVEINLVETPMYSIIENMQNLFQVVALEKNIEFEINTDIQTPVNIYSDKLRLEQIIKNLLTNAFKFTPAYGKVVFSINVTNEKTHLTNKSLRESNNLLCIYIADTGIGIEPAKQELIFEAFKQADGTISRQFGGTGLGLSISKELIARLGGEITLQSTIGEGSIFSIYLPLTAEDNSIKEKKKLENDNLEISDDRDNINKTDSSILIIEDDSKFAAIIKNFAQSRNYKTLIALNGEDGWEIAQKYHPSGIILDINLPIMDGRQILVLLQSHPTLKDVPVYIISAEDNLGLMGKNTIGELKKPVRLQDLNKAFMLLENHIQPHFKSLMILVGTYLTEDSLKPLLNQKFEIKCDFVFNFDEAFKQLKLKDYDSVITEISYDNNHVFQGLKNIRQALNPEVPLIIYLDNDVSPAQALELNKISSTIITHTITSKERLIEELDFFIKKIKSVEKNDTPFKFQTPLDKSLYGKKVLLADDDMRNIFSLTSLLEEYGMEVTIATNGQEALLELNKNYFPDLILMDVMMPIKNGYEAMKEIKANKKIAHIPIFAVTAKAMAEDGEKCMAAGASEYISKPIDNKRLLMLIKKWILIDLQK